MTPSITPSEKAATEPTLKDDDLWEFMAVFRFHASKEKTAKEIRFDITRQIEDYVRGFTSAHYGEATKDDILKSIASAREGEALAELRATLDPETFDYQNFLADFWQANWIQPDKLRIQQDSELVATVLRHILVAAKAKESKKE